MRHVPRVRQIPRIPRPRVLSAENVIILTALVGLAFTAWLVVQVVQLSSDLRDANHARDLLAGQVQQLGGSPIAGPPGSRGDAGAVGPPGPTGPPGQDGRDAPTPSPVPGPTGPSGAPGASGSPGPAGEDGTDSNIPGPAGPQGPAGAPGQPGQAGQPPTGWTFAVDGTTYVCTRTMVFDDRAPWYQCTPLTAAADSPPPTEG